MMKWCFLPFRAEELLGAESLEDAEVGGSKTKEILKKNIGIKGGGGDEGNFDERWRKGGHII